MTYVLILLVGLALGSFVNVIIYRLPTGRTFIKGRSQCTDCNSKIVWYDMMPIVSFFLLKFRCRHCRNKISWMHPSVELYSGLIFVLSFWILGPSGTSTGSMLSPLIYWLFVLFLLELFLILAVIDLKHLILPDSLIISGVAITLIYGVGDRFFLKSNGSILSLNNFFAAILAFLFFFSIWFFSKGRGIGLGDAKFAILIGLVFGPFGSLMVLYCAVVLGTLVGLTLLIAKKTDIKTKLPLGTFIAISASVYILAGPVLIPKLMEIFRFIPFIIN